MLDQSPAPVRRRQAIHARKSNARHRPFAGDGRGPAGPRPADTATACRKMMIRLGKPWIIAVVHIHMSAAGTGRRTREAMDRLVKTQQGRR